MMTPSDCAEIGGSVETEGDRPWTSKLHRGGDVGVSTSPKSRFIRAWSS